MLKTNHSMTWGAVEFSTRNNSGFAAYLGVLARRKPIESSRIQPPAIVGKVEEILTVKCLCLFRTSLGNPQGNQREVRPVKF